MAPYLFAAAVGVATVGVLLAAGFWSPWAGRFVQGVDVSRHQGAIDWRTLASTDIRFAYIKASEGADHVDPMFAQNWRGAGEAGLKRGAYHFFTLCRTGLQQAANFLAVAPAGELPHALDVEHMGPCRRGPEIADVRGEIDAYLDAVEARTGVRPLLYTTREFHDAHLKAVRGERFWLRSLFRWPQFRRRDWVIWQHHHRGSRPGVQGPIDLNSFRGDERAFAAFAGGAP
jgi:lysozyme